MASFSLPQFIAVKTHYGFVHCKSNGILGGKEANVYDPMVKVEVEPAKSNPNYVHLRFCHTNKYWDPDIYSGMKAVSNKPEEDATKASCTMFEPIAAGGPGQFVLKALSMKIRVYYAGEPSINDDRFWLDIDVAAPNAERHLFSFLDWDTLVKLPERVTFFGPNGKYLNYFYDERSLLKFKGDDPNEALAEQTVILRPDGYIQIKSGGTNKLWGRKSDNWISPDWDPATNSADTLFWPVKVDDNIIALRNKGNNQFCKRFTAGNLKIQSCLSASSPNIVNEGRFILAEQVLRRKIYNVRYRMEDARIYDETPFLAGTTTVTNKGDTETSMAVTLTYQDERAFTFTNSVSVTLGVTASFEAGVPGIGKTGIEVSLEVGAAFEWSRTTTITKSLAGTGTVTVGPRSVATVSYVGTQGTCDVPFSYTQQDVSSTQGTVYETKQVDGNFRGVNYYNLNFVVEKSLPLG